MKDLYENGDESMRKLIGESVVKQREEGFDKKTLGTHSKWSNLGGFGSGKEPTPETAAATKAAVEAIEVANKARAEAEAAQLELERAAAEAEARLLREADFSGAETEGADGEAVVETVTEETETVVETVAEAETEPTSA